jgi:hypothetical protein
MASSHFLALSFVTLELVYSRLDDALLGNTDGVRVSEAVDWAGLLE